MTAAAVTDASIKRDLRRIAEQWPGLEHPAKDATGGNGARGIPVSSQALTLMREVPEALTPWVRVCMEDFDADPSGLNTRDAAAIARWLTAWSRLMAQHEAAEEYGAELAQHAERLERCVAGAKMHRKQVSPCPEKVDVGGTMKLCPGDLIAYVRLDGEEDSVVRCNVNPAHEWAARDWSDLANRVTPGGLMLVTIREASALLDIPTGTIRRWVSEDRVQKYPTSDPRLYRVDYRQVEDTRDRLAKVPA